MNASTGKAGAATVSSPSDTPPRSIVVRFLSFRNKEEIIKMRRGFEYEGRKVYLNHDYAPDELKKHKEYCMQRQKSFGDAVKMQTPHMEVVSGITAFLVNVYVFGFVLFKAVCHCCIRKVCSIRGMYGVKKGK